MSRVLAIVLMIVMSEMAASQVISTSLPSTSVSDGYFENLGIGFGFSIPGGRGPGSRVLGLSPAGQITPNLSFQYGGPGAPVFGGGVDGGHFGFHQIGRRGGGFSLGFHWARGSQRSSVTQAPVLTVQNGAGGYIANGHVAPFVSGVVPVVGNRPAVDNAVTRAVRSGQLDGYKTGASAHSPPLPPDRKKVSPDLSSATGRARSVVALKAERQRQIAEKRAQVERTLKEARALVDINELSAARSRFREALREVDDDHLREAIKSEIEATRK